MHGQAFSGAPDPVALDLSATDAFARLRAYAFLEHRLLGDVARDVVARRLRFTQDT